MALFCMTLTVPKFQAVIFVNDSSLTDGTSTINEIGDYLDVDHDFEEEEEVQQASHWQHETSLTTAMTKRAPRNLEAIPMDDETLGLRWIEDTCAKFYRITFYSEEEGETCIVFFRKGTHSILLCIAREQLNRS